MKGYPYIVLKSKKQFDDFFGDQYFDLQFGEKSPEELTDIYGDISEFDLYDFIGLSRQEVLNLLDFDRGFMVYYDNRFNKVDRFVFYLKGKEKPCIAQGPTIAEIFFLYMGGLHNQNGGESRQ